MIAVQLKAFTFAPVLNYLSVQTFAEIMLIFHG